MTNTTDKAMREALQSAFSALDRTDSEPGSDAFEREKEAMDEIRGVLASVPSTGAETKRPHDTEDAELTRDHGPYPEDAPLCQRLMWWIPRSAKHGKTGLESDLVEAAEALALASSAAAPEQAELTTCTCRWNGDTQVQQCTLHEAHVQAIHEWAERAKTAEATTQAHKPAEVPADRAALAAALGLAMDNLRGHGENCFLHDEGEYNACFCGKDSIVAHLQSVLDSKALASSVAAPEQAEWKLVPVEPTPAMSKAAVDAWLDCGSKLFLNKAGAALRAGIAAAKGQQ